MEFSFDYVLEVEYGWSECGLETRDGTFKKTP